MKSVKELVKEGLYNEDKTISNNHVAEFYMKQLEKFYKIGIGRQTEHDVVVTPELIEITEKRLKQLKPLAKIQEKGE